MDIETFNKLVNVGDMVSVRRDNGTLEERRVTHPAEMLGGHTAVVWLEGISGCYDLSRVTPIANKKAELNG